MHIVLHPRRRGRATNLLEPIHIRVDDEDVTVGSGFRERRRQRESTQVQDRAQRRKNVKSR